MRGAASAIEGRALAWQARRLQPGRRPGFSLARDTQWVRETTRFSRYYESAVRTEAQLARWLEYVHHNPMRAGLAASPEEYPYCSAGGKLKTDLETYLGGTWTGQACARGASASGGKARPSGERESLEGEQRETMVV